jgi:cytochrome b561
MRNTNKHYGWLSIIVHWLVAASVIGLFTLGYWMVELSYYDPWYKQGPALHKSIGLLLFFVMLFRIFWKNIEIKPRALKSHRQWEKKMAYLVHGVLFILVFVIMISGYLISTADGRAIEIFQLVSIPSMGALFEHQEDIAGVIHKYLAYTMMLAVFLHALAALKHHFIDKDKTLTRMLGNRQ